jgi:hypothetical protein
MRTVRRLGTVMVISVLCAGIAASCALPAYHAGESSSGSGSGGKAAASSGAGGQGGSADTTSSASGNVTDAGDASNTPDCHPVMVCGATDLLGKSCACPKSVCLHDACKSDNDASQGEGLFCGPQGVWVSVPAALTCCPFDASSCMSGEACVFGVKLSGTAIPTALKSFCAPYMCKPGMVLDCNCFTTPPCSQLSGTTCSAFPLKNAILCSMP